MVGTGSPVSFRRRPPLTSRGCPDCQSSATVNPRVGTRVRRGPVRHDNHTGQRMTPGAPTDGARSRLPGHRGSTEAGTTLKDSGEPHRASKGVPCVSPLIDEAGAGFPGSSPMRSTEASGYPQRSLRCRDSTSALLTVPSRQCFRALVVIPCRHPHETTSTSLHTTRDLSTTHQPLPYRPLPCTRRCTHAKDPGLVTCVRTRPGSQAVPKPDYSRKFMPKSMAPSASRKSSDTEPSPKSASE